MQTSSRRLARGLVREAGRVPLLRTVVSGAYDRYFNGAEGRVRLFNGVFSDFASAERAVPAGKHSGYDNEPSAQRVLDEWLYITPSDYPTMFWLSKILGECSLLFDWGGNVGLTYFAYRRYLSYPAGLVWCVNDVPAVVALGKQVAERESAPALRFTTAFDELAGADVLLAAGSFQFIEDPFEPLRRAPALPLDALVTKVPVCDRPAAVTLHNMGTAFCPYHLFNRDAFVGEFASLGYRLADEWPIPGLGCQIPLSPERSIEAYSGFYFTRRPPA